jgi:hypothetical protein
LLSLPVLEGSKRTLIAPPKVSGINKNNVNIMKSISKVVTISLMISCLLSVSCKTTEVALYEGGDRIITGTGGTKQVIQGIDVWDYGTPPRAYKILAVISDERFASGLVGKALMDEMYTDLATKAIEHGGDAIIVQTSDTETTGFTNIGGGGYAVGNNYYSYGSSSVAKKKNFSKSLIVKYTD